MLHFLSLFISIKESPEVGAHALNLNIMSSRSRSAWQGHVIKRISGPYHPVYSFCLMSNIVLHSVSNQHVGNWEGSQGVGGFTWRRHQMKTFSELLALCAGNSLVPSEFPTQRPVTWSFDVFFDLRLNKRLSKKSWDWWFETLSHPLWRQCNVWHINVSEITGRSTAKFNQLRL